MKKIVVLGTGGTIAGWAPDVDNPRNYAAAQLTVNELLSDWGRHSDTLVWDQVAQIDSKNMNWSVWKILVARIDYWLKQADVAGLVITHGTDTMEETAYLLHTFWPRHKPIALVGAMLPANAIDGDGPQNIKDALELIRLPLSTGVYVVHSGKAHDALTVTKLFNDRVDAFASIHGQLLSDLRKPMLALVDARFERGVTARTVNVEVFLAAVQIPRVEVVSQHAAADGSLVLAAMSYRHPPVAWVVAGTGNGTMSDELQAVMLDAQRAGARVWRSSRCAFGHVHANETDFFKEVTHLNPAKSRIALTLAVMADQLAL